MFTNKFPCYTQLNNMDCGPTCLKMICSFYGIKQDVELIRDLCCFSKTGVSLLALQHAAEKLGFESIGVKCKLEELNEMPLPCILHWNQGHYVVLYKIQKRGNDFVFFVSDPIGYRFSYSSKEFSNCWLSADDQGVLLCLEPNVNSRNDFQVKNANNTKNNVGLLSYLKGYRTQFTNILAGILFTSILTLLLPFLTQAIVDIGIAHKNISFIKLILIAQLVLIIGANSVDFIKNWILLRVGMRINITIISDFILKITRLPISFFDQRMTGDILQRIGDHSRIKDFLTETCLTFTLYIFNILILGTILLIYSWIIFAIFFMGSAIYLIWVTFFMRKRAVLDNKLFAQNAAIQGSLYELVYGMQEIKLNGCEDQKRWKWEKIQVQIYNILRKGLTISQYQTSGGIIINQVKNAVITTVVAVYTINGQLSLGMMIAIQFIIGQLNSPIEQLIGLMHKYQDAKLSNERLNDVYAIPNENDDQSKQIIGFDGDISFSNVSFKYDKLDEQYTLTNINLTIPKGKTTAIVGLSGSGKTTLLKLILGFYVPQEGEIYIGGIALSDCDINQWRMKCGVVMQDGYIFSDSISSNISPKEEDINLEQMKFAAHVANIDSFIESLPLSYKTQIGHEGKGLSLGQKQRILIARAVYKKPQFIFLDEATNSLDANNEIQIMDSLNKFLVGKTSVIIAHRLSTVRNADKIIVMDKGKIVEEGKHESLIAMRGLYYTLVKNQLNI